MKVLIVDNHTDYIEPLKTLLSNFEITVKFYTDLVITDKDNYDLIVLTGGYHRFPVYKNPPENKIEIEIVLQTSKPVIGICYGCQLIAYAYDSNVGALTEKVNELKEIEFKQDFLDYKIGDRIKVKESHRFSVMGLGKDLESIAASENGFEIIKVKDKKIYGFQFHPELEKEKSGGDEIFAKLLTSLNI